MLHFRTSGVVSWAMGATPRTARLPYWGRRFIKGWFYVRYLMRRFRNKFILLSLPLFMLRKGDLPHASFFLVKLEITFIRDVKKMSQG